ncbi:sugar ABC transporter permease [Gammaproteobacteria bacterium]|nr:sugar ABC transporter permease [Gammaproteobacteria bacterium]
MFAVAGYPLFETIRLGFTDARGADLATGDYQYTFKNYYYFNERLGRPLGLLVDDKWWSSVWFTIKFAFVTVSLETVLGMMVALVMNASFKGRGLMRAVILVPWAVPTIISAALWKWVMLHGQVGIINDLLVNQLGWLDEKIAFTASSPFWSAVMVDVWKTTPFMALLILAGLQTIPSSVYEAARIDGVPATEVFWKVTLPLVSPALMVAIIFRALDALRVFDVLYVLIGYKQGSTSMTFFAQNNIGASQKFGYGSAAATLIFLIIALITIVYIMTSRVDLGDDK